MQYASTEFVDFVLKKEYIFKGNIKSKQRIFLNFLYIHNNNIQ